MKKVLILSFCFLIASCGSVAKTVYGVKSPTFKNTKAQVRFLKKYNQEKHNFFYYKDLRSFIVASQGHKLGVPEAYFFNKRGDYVPYKKSTEECNAKVDVFLKDLANITQAEADPNWNTGELLNLLKSEPQILLQDSEITVFLTWATFAGKVNKIKTFEWIALLEKAKQNGISVNYYLVSCDLQEGWGLTKQQKKKIQHLIQSQSQ